MTDVLKSPANPISALAPKWKRFNTALHLGRTSIDQASFYMLSLYRTNLEVRLRSIDEASLQPDSQKKIYALVTEMLKAPAKGSIKARNLEWDEFYKAESLIALLFSGAQLRQEISVRLQELAQESLAEADALRQVHVDLLKSLPEDSHSESTDAALRTFLLRVMEAIHWNSKKKYLARPIRKEATNRILAGLLVAFACLVTPYLFLMWDYNNDPLSPVWSQFALWTALSAGLLGAFFSRLISIQRQWAKMSLEEVFLHREWPYTLLRAGVGLCGALIVYFFLRSGIAAGALFPVFDGVQLQYVDAPRSHGVGMTFVMPSKDLALLTFWCFLAGFSEALVPSLLSGTERQFIEATTTTQPAGRK